MDETTVYLDDKRLRRFELFDRLQLTIAAFTLMVASFERLNNPDTKDLVLAILQLLTSLVVIGFVVRWVRTRHVPSAARVGWLDLMAGLMLLVEWADRYLQSGRVLTAVLCQALVFLVLGLAHTKMVERQQRGRFVRVDDHGIRIRRSVLRRRSIAWSEVASVSREPQAIRITRRNGAVWRLRLRRYENGDEVARLLLSAAEARGLGPGSTP